ncbi:MAG: type III-B CRISPR module-associated protein Cmr5 [Acidobacteria bacterium]|nr:type III-B CRISPR module-associated protein Cmr5 [Acidobacteriota bacterium]MBI3657024.1 type III-B CRISPR module-associated protein Cmr5 [Acidobacteriota bacterium]
MTTRDQQRAQKAYTRVAARLNQAGEAEYKRFSRSFPALVHTCGLAQAIAYGQVKAPVQYMSDLADIIGLPDAETLARAGREAPLPDYQRYSREALASATWIKRYADAVLRGED